MNQYASRLLALQQAPSHKLKEIGDQWQSPEPLAWGLFHRFAPMIGPVVIDLFADDCNALVANYYTAADNALLQDWAGDSRRLGGSCYANPPYSRQELDDDGNPITGMEAILEYCRTQRELGAKIMLLIKAATSDGWWPEDADMIQFISGRVGFNAPSWYKPRDQKLDKPSSAGFPSAVVIFDKDWKWERRPVERLNRDDLMTTGQIILDMIDARVDQIVELLDSSPSDEPIHMEEPQISTETVDKPADASQEPVTATTTDINDDVNSHPESLMEVPACYSSAQSIFETALVSDEHAERLLPLIDGWLSERMKLAEIFYRLNLAEENINEGLPFHTGFVDIENRYAVLPGWRVHPEVQKIMNALNTDQMGFTHEVNQRIAGEIINAIGDGINGYPLIEHAKNIAKDLMHEFELSSHSELVTDTNKQLPMPGLDEPQEDQVDPSFLQVVNKSLTELFCDYNNDELACDNWTRFVITLTVLFGQQETYTAQQIRFALCGDEPGLTSISKAQQSQIVQCTMVISETEKHLPLNDTERQLVVMSCITELEQPEQMPLVGYIKMARDVVTKSRCEVAA